MVPKTTVTEEGTVFEYSQKLILEEFNCKKKIKYKDIEKFLEENADDIVLTRDLNLYTFPNFLLEKNYIQRIDPSIPFDPGDYEEEYIITEVGIARLNKLLTKSF